MTTMAAPGSVSLEGAVQGPLAPLGAPSAEQLSLINRFARTPLTADQVYVFDMEISNDLYDSYATRMDPSTTLANYASDYADGRALLNSHNTRELPIGSSFAARIEPRGVPDNASDPKRTAVVASWFIQRGIRLNGVSNDDVIRGIDGGTIRDASTHFADADYMCDVCGEDMMRSWDCEHIPGVPYEDGKRASATIRNAHALEGSLVFDGSTPMAMVDKAERMAGAGKLTPKQLRCFEDVYNVRVRGTHGVRVVAVDGPEPLRPNRTHSYLDLVPPSVRAAMRKDLVKMQRAVAGSYEDRQDLLKDALNKFYDDADVYIWLVATTDDSVAYNVDGGDDSGTYSVDYAVDDKGSVTLGTPVEATVTQLVTPKDRSRGYRTWGELTDEERAAWATLHMTQRQKRASRGRSAGRITGAPMDPKAFVDLITSGIPVETRGQIGERLLTGLEVDRSFVEAVAAGVTARAGSGISADSASQIQSALDHMSDAQESHDAAIEALKQLVAMGGMEADDMPTEGQPDLDAMQQQGKTAVQTGAGLDATGLQPEGSIPANGSIGRSAKGTKRSEVEQSSGIGADVKAKLVEINNVLTDLLADDEDDDSAGNDEDDDTMGRAHRAALRAEVAKPEYQLLRGTIERIREGQRYRASLVEGLHEWGVRARGSGYQRDLFERMAPSLSARDLEELTRQFQADALKRFANRAPGDIPDWAKELGTGAVGRQTVPVANPYGPNSPGKAAATVQSTTVDLGAFTTKPQLRT